MIGQGNSGPECESPLEEGVRGVSSGGVSLHVKDTLAGELLASSRN